MSGKKEFLNATEKSKNQVKWRLKIVHWIC